MAEDADFAKALLVQLEDADKAGVGTVFNVNIFGGEVGEIINIDKLEGGLTITKTSKSQNPEKYESSGNTSSSGRYSLLLENLVRYFSINDLRTISFELGLDYENLKGDTKQVLARELISYCEHRGQIPDLVAVCKEQRPRVEKWI